MAFVWACLLKYEFKEKGRLMVKVILYIYIYTFLSHVV